MLQPKPWRIIGIVSLLALAMIVPVILSGVIALRAGRDALESGAYLDASIEYEAAARKLTWRADLWELAGTSAYAGGDPARAADLLQRARDHQVLSGTAWQVLGSALWESGRPAEAMETWREGTIQRPEEAGLWDRLAAAYHDLRDYEAEQASLESRLQVQDDAAARYRLGLLLMLKDTAGAVRMLDAAAALDPSVRPAATTLKGAIQEAAAQARPQGLVVLGRGLGLVEEWALAEHVFSLAADADKTNASARAWLGEARQHLGLDGRADLDAALAMGWDESEVHALRGLYWRREGNLALSLAEYARASQLEPGNPALKTLLGEAYAASGDLVAALAAYESAVELAPAESQYWRLLALFSADNDVQVVDLGVAAAMKAVELAPDDPQALDALGWALAQAGYLFRAEEALLRAIERNPNFAMAHVHLGLTYLRWGQNDNAFEHLTRAREIDRGGSAGEYAARLLGAYFPSQPQ